MGLRVAEFNSTQKRELKVGSFMKKKCFYICSYADKTFPSS